MCKENLFSIDKSFYQPIKHLSDEALGKLFRAIFEYQIDGKSDCEPEISIAFQFFVVQFGKDAKMLEQRLINGSKGGRPKRASRNNILDSDPELKNAVYNVYRAYPVRCPKRGSSTSKGARSKDKIIELLQSYSQEQLIEAINVYVTDCKKSGTYLKNFGTFLNNLPDMEENSEGNIGEKKIKWHISSLNSERTGSTEQFELEKKRYGETNIELIGYVN